MTTQKTPSEELDKILEELAENTEYPLFLRFSPTTKQWWCGYKGYDFGSTADSPRKAILKLYNKWGDKRP